MKKRQQNFDGACKLVMTLLRNLRHPVTRTFLVVVGLCVLDKIAYGDDIAFFYALDADFNSLKSESVVVGQAVKTGKYRVQRLELAGHHIFAVKMGSGATETASSASAVLAKFQCTFAISLGPAGSLDDVANLSSWWRVKNIIGYQKGAWTAIGGFKSGDSVMLDNEAAKRVYDRIKFPPLLSEEKKASVASGEIFVASSMYREQLHASTKAQMVDMNLLGLQTACAAFDVPLLAWKVVSDHADDNAGNDFRTFAASYQGDGGKAVALIIRSLPLQSDSPEAFPKLKELLEKPVDSSGN